MDGEWEFISDDFAQVDVGRLGAFGVDINGDIYYRVGSQNGLRGDSWQLLPHSPMVSIEKVSVGGDAVLAHGYAASMNINVHIEIEDPDFDAEGKITGSFGWTEAKFGNKVPMSEFTVLKANDEGVIWGLTDEKIWDDYDGWEEINLSPEMGFPKQIDVGQFGVFCVDQNDHIFYRIGFRIEQHLPSAKSFWFLSRAVIVS